MSPKIIRTGAALLTFGFMSACKPPTAAVEFQETTVASEAVNGDDNNGSLCLASSIGLVTMENSNVKFTGNGLVGGDAVLLGDGPAKISGNGSVLGTVYIKDANNLKMSGNASVGSVSSVDLSNQIKTIVDTNKSFQDLVATVTLSGIKDSTTIIGNGGLNVVSVDGDLSLSGKRTLLLKGGASDTFVVRVSGSIRISGGASIDTLGTPANRVLIANTGSGSGIGISGQSRVVGTIFAPGRGLSVTGGGTIEGSVISSGDVKVSGNGEIIKPAAFCSEAPIIVPPPGDDDGGDDDTPPPPPGCDEPMICENF